MLPPLQGLFDRYWNADAVYPIHKVMGTPLSPDHCAPSSNEWTGLEITPPPGPLPPTDILGYGPIAEDLEDGRLGLTWAEAYVFADHPDKPFDGEAGGELQDTSVTYNVFEAIRKAEKDLVISSPYLVPGPSGMELLRELRERNVHVVAMTNSLGSTDEPVVHAGYVEYREPMLELGVDLYEVSGSRVKKNRRQNLFGASLGRLHAKLAVVDKKTIFVGSMNLDPRSATINTELGAVIHSPELAREMIRIIDIDRLQSAYRLAPEQGGHLLRVAEHRGRPGGRADRRARLHGVAALQDLPAAAVRAGVAAVGRARRGAGPQPSSCSVAASRSPPQYLSSSWPNSGSCGAAHSNSVRHERSLSASIEPKICSALRPCTRISRPQHSRSRAPSSGCCAYARASASETMP